MKTLHTMGFLALFALAAASARADALWDYENSTTTGSQGLGPYFGTSTDTLIAGGTNSGDSTMEINPSIGATSISAFIDFGGPSGTENFIHINSSSKDIQGCQLQFDLVADSAVIVNSLSYDALVYHVNQGPGSISWSYSIDGGSVLSFPTPPTDTFSNQGTWQSYTPIFGLVTTGPATIHIYGTISSQITLEGNNNGEIGFDAFNFNVTPTPEPAPLTLLLAGLGLLAWRKAAVKRTA